MHEHNFSLDNIITSGLVVCTAYLTPVITKQKDQCYQNEIITGSPIPTNVFFVRTTTTTTTTATIITKITTTTDQQQ